jgi:predicted metal-dependent phosphoesterase TrpH
LVQLALENNLSVIALTDHDTTEGLAEASEAARGTGLTVIAGVEISTDVSGRHEFHILGYYIDWEYAPLQVCLQNSRRSRLNRAHQILELLAQTGHPISWEQVSALAGQGSIGRPHIAQAMVKAGYVESVEKAFRRYLGRGAPAYVPRPKLLPEKAIQLVLDAGGAPVLAHPSQIVEHIPGLAKAGLAGLEVYYSGYLAPEIRFLTNLAHRYNLIATGGSDFHGAGIMNTPRIGRPEVPWSAVEQLQVYARRKARDHVER